MGGVVFGGKKPVDPQRRVADLRARLAWLARKDKLTAVDERFEIVAELAGFEQWAAVEAECRVLVHDLARHRGPRGGATLAAWHNLALALWGLDRLEEALPLFVELVDAYTHVWGVGHPTTLDSCRTVARALRAADREPEAVPLYQELVAGLVIASGQKDAQVREARLELAQCQRYLGRFDDAERTLAELAATERKPGGSPATQRLRANLAVDRKQYAAGVSGLRDCLGQTAEGSLDRLSVQVELAGALVEQGSYPEAVRLLEETAAEYTRRLGAGDDTTRWARLSLACALVETDRVLEAEPHALAALEGATLRPSRSWTLDCQGVLARVAFARGDVDRAAALGVEVHSGFVALLGADHPRTLEAQRFLAT